MKLFPSTQTTQLAEYDRLGLTYRLAAKAIVFFVLSVHPVHTSCPCFNLALCPWSYAKGLQTQYLTNRLWDFFLQIYNICACRDKDELIRFWGQKVKCQGHSQIRCGQVSTSGSISYKPLVEIPQIYHSGADLDKDGRTKFWGQKVKCQGHDKTKYG